MRLPGPAARLRPRARDAAVAALTTALRRVAGRGSVIVPHYELRPRARYGWEGAPIPALARIIDGWLDLNRDRVVADLADLTDWCEQIPRHAADGPRWDNDYWGSLDAVWQISVLRRLRPARYVEIGSGFSTLFARRAIEDFGLPTRIVSIDPSPRTEVDAVCDEVIRSRLEDADLSVFADVDAGDVVLLDGSHVATMNSDAVVFLMEVLPSLPAGVAVGIDDVFLPWDYHPTWVGHWYGEQYLVAAYLLGGAGGDEIAFPGWALSLAIAHDTRVERLWRAVETRFGRRASSFWLERGSADGVGPRAAGPVEHEVRAPLPAGGGT